MTHTVYYTFHGVSNDNPLRVTELINSDLDPLMPELKRKYGGGNSSDILQCYALQEHCKNTFVYRAPVSMDVEFTGDERGYTISGVELCSQSDFDALIATMTSIDAPIQLFSGYGVSFISEQDSLPLTVLPANYHKTGVSPFPMLSGAFDCAKWFRPIHPAILNEQKIDFSIKKGDPLLYIKFHTDERVELKRFTTTRETAAVTQAVHDYKKFVKRTPLNKLYSIFKRSRLKTELLREIKSQL